MTTLLTNWHKEEGYSGELKEVSGGKSIFKWCCMRRMTRILRFQKIDGKILQLGDAFLQASAWHCEVCGRREENEPEIM